MSALNAEALRVLSLRFNNLALRGEAVGALARRPGIGIGRAQALLYRKRGPVKLGEMQGRAAFQGSNLLIWTANRKKSAPRLGCLPKT
jgi:hypothetical protein